MPVDPNIGNRERDILTAIVETFISTGEPVGSRTLARSNREGLSPASIRNVMADLSDAGFLEQPHASAGRVPTTEAYRYYVEQISGDARLAPQEESMISDSLAGITDVLDGYFARKWGVQSSFGRMLDPIADKLLVASCLLMLAGDGTIRGWSLWAAIVILCREILVSGLREYLAELRVSVPVTQLAKWKTTLQLVAVGFLIAGKAGDLVMPIVTPLGLTLLWLSALLTLYTGWDYFRAGVRHLIEE